MLEVLLIMVLMLAALVYVAAPLLAVPTATATGSPSQGPQVQAYDGERGAALQDLEDDYHTGKIFEEEYTAATAELWSRKAD